MGVKGNRNTGKGQSDRTKFILVGITSDSGSKEVSTRRTPEKKAVCGLSEGEFIATGGQMHKGTGCLSLYPLPKIDEMFAKLKGAKFFSTIDLRSGYYHIGLTRESRAKSAFVVPMGKWEFKHTPFGLSQAPACFQLLIDKVLMGCSKFAMGYLDDIIIFSNSELEHLQHIEEILKRLERFGLKMKREKCDFFKKHIQYLGHLIAEEGFTPLPEKLESIRKMLRPKTPKEVKQFLGLIGYYRKFVPRFSDIARSLTNLTRHDVNFNWTEKCDKAFNHLNGYS